MIEERRGDILQASDIQALVNPVNCAGRIGAGQPRAFARAYPDAARQYTLLCEEGKIRPGTATFHRIAADTQRPAWLVWLTTKEHWCDPGRLAWLRNGMADLMEQMNQRPLRSVAIPLKGAGLGGINPAQVRLIIKEEASRWPDTNTILYIRG